MAARRKLSSCRPWRSDRRRLPITRRPLFVVPTCYVIGTLFGVLILGVIQTLISFDGSLSSWWTRIVIGVLLFVSCLLQRMFEARRS